MDSQLAVRQPDAIARPNTFTELLELATILVKTKGQFLPAAIDTPEKAAAIMIAGREIGLSGMQSFRELYSVKGQIGMSTRLIAAFYKRTGGTYDFLERTADKCTVRLTLASGAQHDFTLTRAEADQAGYTRESKDGQQQEKYNWRANPKGMLSNNCLKGAIRLWCPECLLDVLGPMVLPEAETVEAQVVEVVEPEATPAPGNGNGNGHKIVKDAQVIEHEAVAFEEQGPKWSQGVILTNTAGESKHWYNWQTFRDQFWAWADKRTLSPKEVCEFLGIAKTDDIATLDVTMKGIVDLITSAIAAKRGPDVSKLPF